MTYDPDPQASREMLNTDEVESSKSCEGREPSQITTTGNFNIEFPDATVAEDAKVVASIVEIVNQVYREAETGIFLPGYQRTHDAEISELIRQGLLAIAYRPATYSGTQQEAHLASCHGEEETEVVGCVYVNQLSATLGNLGMLALDGQHRGGGLGRAMVRFAEDYCQKQGCQMMQLELLVPTTIEHAFKSRMQGWYERMGYRVVKLGDFKQEYPALAIHLAGPAEYRIFEKNLA